MAHHVVKETVQCLIVTISDTRTDETDKSGKLMSAYMEDAGHMVVEKVIVPDEKQAIKQAILQGIEDDYVDVVLTNGGTGISHRDVTIETVTSIIEKEMTGFGEIFRMLSYTDDIGSKAILSRAIAGVSGHTAIFTTPGSSGAVKLAMEKLIVPEILHVVNEIQKDC